VAAPPPEFISDLTSVLFCRQWLPLPKANGYLSRSVLASLDGSEFFKSCILRLSRISFVKDETGDIITERIGLPVKSVLPVKSAIRVTASKPMF
jgi:hypothetical protein